MKTSEIKFTVTLDENNLPEKIDWSATDANEKSVSKAVMIALWDAKENNTLRIDLWTKDMMVDEMKLFYHQSLLSMADTFDRATGETETAKEMRGFAQHFAEKMKLIAPKQP
ncbi:MAG: gliding motility protein GldC [Bacteroidetes bacterium RIFCSPLOWO2_12_FULL_35_15]|nr:MAG: gliding motility protein GldC [Bacteroidetes bacterium RIFCSPLOWO2_12_FULL_35_15]